MAFNYSPHKSGTWHDADFWLQMQNSISQLVTLVIANLSLRKGSMLPRWVMLIPTGVALVCALATVPLYCVVPTEWSAFAMTVASTIQVFMMLQLACIGE